jgi:arylsulfatase A-like enzyme
MRIHTTLLFTIVTLVVGETIAVAQERPNVVLLMADDQGFGDVAYNGNPHVKTPVLDEMAATCLRLDRYYAAAPVCSPTRGSVLTGRHPNRFGCFSWGHSLRPEEVTLAEVLQTAGYATGHFGKWHLGSLEADSLVSPGKSGFGEWFSSPNFFENSPLLCRNGKVEKTEGEGSQVIVDAAVEFIRKSAAANRPFFTVIWFGSPHGPHQALDDDKKLYADQPPAMQNYWGEITAMDRAIGHLRKELRGLGVADNTLVWYTSDNGATTPGSTGGLRGKKASIWEGGLRVPAIIEWPAAIKSPRRSELPSCSVDIYPTIIDLVGVSAPTKPVLDGISLKPLLISNMNRRDKPLGFWHYAAPGRGVNSHQILQQMASRQTGAAANSAAIETKAAETPRYSETDLPGHAAWLDGNWKLHRIANRGGEAKFELYDLAADMQETTDLVGKETARGAAMKSELAAWQRSVVRSLNGEDYK